MKQIIAIGGGGFSMESENLLLDQYVLSQSKKDSPEICFLATASGDAENYIKKFYDFFSMQNCSPSHLSLSAPPMKDLETFLLEKDIIYVGGGSTKNLLALWRKWGIDNMLKKAWNQGIILTGISAGSICWFEEGVTDSFGEGLEPIQCLGFLKGSNCPHYDGKEKRRCSYKNLIKTSKIKEGVAADDGVAIHYINEEIKAIVSSSSDAKAYKVFFESEVKEEVLPVKFLGK